MYVPGGCRKSCRHSEVEFPDATRLHVSRIFYQRRPHFPRRTNTKKGFTKSEINSKLILLFDFIQIISWAVKKFSRIPHIFTADFGKALFTGGERVGTRNPVGASRYPEGQVYFAQGEVYPEGGVYPAGEVCSEREVTPLEKILRLETKKMVYRQSRDQKRSLRHP